MGRFPGCSTLSSASFINGSASHFTTNLDAEKEICKVSSLFAMSASRANPAMTLGSEGSTGRQDDQRIEIVLISTIPHQIGFSCDVSLDDRREKREVMGKTHDS
jgi:hypothetical protein